MSKKIEARIPPKELIEKILNKEVDWSNVSFEGEVTNSELILESAGRNHTMNKIMLGILCLMVLVTVVLSIGVTQLSNRKPITLGYGIFQDGTLVELEPVDQKSKTDAQVITWASKMSRNIHNLSFVDAERHVDNLKFFFTPDAYDNYQRALLNSSVWESVTKRNRISWAEHTTAGKIIDSGLDNGVYYWVVEMELNLFIGKTNPTPVVSKMVVIRTSKENNNDGLLVDGYIVKKVQ